MEPGTLYSIVSPLVAAAIAYLRHGGAKKAAELESGTLLGGRADAGVHGGLGGVSAEGEQQRQGRDGKSMQAFHVKSPGRRGAHGAPFHGCGRDILPGRGCEPLDT